MAKQIAIGSKVNIESETSMYDGDWGIVTRFDGESYQVAMFGGTDTQAIFSRDELKVCKKQAVVSLALR